MNITLSYNEISYNNTCNFGDVSPDPVPNSYIPSNCSGAGESVGVVALAVASFGGWRMPP